MRERRETIAGKLSEEFSHFNETHYTELEPGTELLNRSSHFVSPSFFTISNLSKLAPLLFESIN